MNTSHQRSLTSAAATNTALPGWLVWLMAGASGLMAANLFYIQPVLGEIARSFAATEQDVGMIATLGQLGYAVGLLLIVPLGDTLNRRTLLVTTILAVSAALSGVALAPSLFWLAVAVFAVGALTIGAQILLPLAASLALPSERGRVVGTVMSGLLIGVLLARTVSGIVGAHWGWRAMFWLAAFAMVALAAVLRFSLPHDPPRASIRYTTLLRSLWTLVRTQPVVREASLFGALGFGAFNAFWVTLAFFLERPPYQYGSDIVGAFGLVGVVGALAASGAGRLSDRMAARTITGLGLAIMLGAYALFWLLGGWIWGLIGGVILLDLGQQAGHIANQTRVYALMPEARARLNTVYIVSCFLGASLGSSLAAVAWGTAGWSGVCAVGGLMLAGALAAFAARGLRR